MDADLEQNDYDVFRRDVYRVAVTNEFESQENRRIVRSIGEDDDDEDFDDLEALRLAALRSLGTKNAFAKEGLSAADLSSTRRVSLGRKDKSDLQVVSLERQESFSSTSTDYEEIDLSERTPPDSEANDSGSDVDDAESDKKIEMESPRDDQEMEYKEDSDEGRNVDDDENDLVTDEENNSVWSDNEDFGDNVVLTDEGGVENNISTDEDDVENNFDVSGEDSDEDIQESSQNYLEALEALEDELNDSANEVNVLNDISITIANESLVSHSPTNLDEHLEIVDDEYEDNTGLNQEIESENESINELQMTSTQRIVVSQSDSENESDVKDENKTEMTKENQCAGRTEMTVDQPVADNHNLKENKESVLSSAISPSEKVKTAEVLVLKSKSENIPNAENEKPTDVVPKPSLKIVKNTSSKLPSAEKPGLGTLPNLKKDKTQELLSKGNTVQKAKESKEPRNVKGTMQKDNEKVSSKAVDCDNKVEISANKESKFLSTEPTLKTESEEKMDFDQLSIEDEDSDFEEEEEENQPTVKSKIGLNKIPTEGKKRKRSFSSENNRTKRHSRSPERSRASSRSYRDRQRDQRLHDRSREGFSKRRSLSPSTDRRYRGSDSHYRRSRSRDRKQNRISSAKGRDRESRHYRSRSRSNSRTRSSTTAKVVKTKNDKPIKKESIKGSVKERLEVKKNSNTRTLSTSPRKEIKSQDKDIEEKTVRTKQAKSLSVETKIANGTKVVSKPKIQRDVDGVIIKQPKDLRSRLLEKKEEQNEVDIKNVSTVNESNLPVKDRELSTRIQRVKPQKEAVRPRVKQSAEKKSSKESTSLVKERELDERIQRIKQQNEAILKRAKEIEAEKMKFHS